jgi:YaaC-like protein
VRPLRAAPRWHRGRARVDGDRSWCSPGRKLGGPAPVAQWIERSPPEREVGRSNRPGRASKLPVNRAVLALGGALLDRFAFSQIGSLATIGQNSGPQGQRHRPLRCSQWCGNDQRALVLRNLRATRANPPSRAADDPYRRALYGAALERFEQLLHAASEVDAAARPLPLFYALSQAGRAIVAARADDPDIDGHGLAEDRQKPAPDDLLHRRVKRAPSRSNKDAFGAVVRATGSPDLIGAVELGALWATLPQTYRLPTESWLPEWRQALWVMDQGGQPAPGQHRVQAWSMSGNPHYEAVDSLRGAGTRRCHRTRSAVSSPVTSAVPVTGRSSWNGAPSTTSTRSLRRCTTRPRAGR